MSPTIQAKLHPARLNVQRAPFTQYRVVPHRCRCVPSQPGLAGRTRLRGGGRKMFLTALPSAARRRVNKRDWRTPRQSPEFVYRTTLKHTEMRFLEPVWGNWVGVGGDSVGSGACVCVYVCVCVCVRVALYVSRCVQSSTQRTEDADRHNKESAHTHTHTHSHAHTR